MAYSRSESSMKYAMSVFVVLSLNVPSLPAKADQYLCVSDKVTGFHYDTISKSWRQSRFNPIVKYVIYPPGKDAIKRKSAKYLLRVVGSSYPIAYCGDAVAMTGDDADGIIRCADFSIELIFNKQNGRFSAAMQGYSYYADGTKIKGKMLTDATADTPTLQIGSCFAF
jgi:hypothetical protein